MLDNERHTYCERAHKDALKALKLNKYSWNAKYIIAHCHQLNDDLSKALLHYNLALSLSPAQHHVHVDFDACKFLQSIQCG